MANYEKALGRWLEGETERQMAIAAIALERYRLRRGRYPDSLKDLVPDFIPEPPIDYMDGKPLRYRRTLKSFLLYSIGRNGRDDDGDPTSGNFAEPLSIWNADDAVWPTAKGMNDE